MTQYRTIVADPPWHYPFGHPARDHKKHPYPTLSIGELCELPVYDWADQSAHLYLWTTNEHLRYAFSVLGAWGFTFKNVLTWCKPGLGMGGTFRNSSEIILLGQRGKCELKRRDVGTWHVWPNPKENSQKPEAFLDLVESVSHGPYLEMFARRNRMGWDTWGNESLEHLDYTWIGALDANYGPTPTLIGHKAGQHNGAAVAEYPQRSGKPRPPEDEPVVRGGGSA